MSARYQYCKVHNVVEECPSCDASGRLKVATMHPNDRPVVWEHPETGEIRYPGRNDGQMPKYYKEQGYQRKEFLSYNEHQKFNKEKGLVNHRAEDIRE